MITQNWKLFDNILLSWEITPSQLYITLNCSSRSKRFMEFCNNALKEIHGNFNDVVKAICSPSLSKYDFLTQACEDSIKITYYLNIIFMVLLISATIMIFSIIFLMIYSKSFKIDNNNNNNEIVLKSKPLTGLAIVSIILNIFSLLGVCSSTIITIYLSHIIPNLLTFVSDIPMYNIESYNNSLGWGFYLLLLANSLLIVHILALVDSTHMAKKLWNYTLEIKNKKTQHNELIINTKNKIPEKYFVNDYCQMNSQDNNIGSTFLSNSNRIQSSNQYSVPYNQISSSPQVYPKISNKPITKSVWGFFPISLLPRYNPYNSGMNQIPCIHHEQECHDCYHHHHHHHNHHQFH